SRADERLPDLKGPGPEAQVQQGGDLLVELF
ncbi:hypothetical protein TIFTF001_040797, partial [Ficus carica]